MSRKPLIMANWKLNGSKEFAMEFISNLANKTKHISNCNFGVAVPFVYIQQVSWFSQESSIKVAAQNVDINKSGAFTGEVSIDMLKDCGATYVIIGHSERRQYHKENDEIIAEKFSIIKESGLTPILCIGETESQNENGQTKAVCQAQIDAIINKLGVEAFNNAVIAYEPIWAIGTGKSATPEQAQAVHGFIRNYIASKNIDVAQQLIIQYGGSVNEKNAAELFLQPDIDGALVGGASLKVDSFVSIIEAAQK